MLDRKRKTKEPCQKCFLHLKRCICHLLVKMRTETKVTLIVHHRELKRTTNTGRLAIEALTNSEMLIRGLKGAPLDLKPIENERESYPLLFFPGEESVELTHDYLLKIDKPIHLIVPDGNWRQASKVGQRHPELSKIPRVQITKPNLQKFHLRNESSRAGMATLQAIAEALRIIEGEVVFEHLMKIYNAKLTQTLYGRGISGQE